MKTLDEVIKGFECCQEINCAECPYANWDNTDVARCNDTNKEDDALHYLKAFRDAKDALDTERERYAEAVKNCEVAENKYKRLCEETPQKVREASQNSPLTWSELQQMEGKPVWMEDSNDKGEWVLLSGTEDEYLYFVYRDCVEYKIYRDEQGKRWRAYRKERE